MREKIMSLFLISIIILTNFSYGIFVPNIYKADDDSIVAYAELNAATIQLPSGEKIQKTNINGDTKMQVQTITKPVELVMILDISGSMGGGRLEYTKKAAAIFLENLFSKIEKVRVSVITYNDKTRVRTTGSTNKDGIISLINGLSAKGGTDMLPALNKAYDILGDRPSGYSPFMIILADGDTTNRNSAAYAINKMYRSGMQLYAVLVGASTGDAKMFEGSATVYQDIEDNKIPEVYEDIFQDMCTDLTNVSVSDFFVENAKNYFLAADDLYMILDNEITQGARLDLEYIINIKSSKPVSILQLQNEVDKKLSFDPSSKMISEDKTNEDYGWKANDYLSYKKGHQLVLSIYESAEKEEENNDEKVKEDVDVNNNGLGEEKKGHNGNDWFKNLFPNQDNKDEQEEEEEDPLKEDLLYPNQKDEKDEENEEDETNLKDDMLSGIPQNNSSSSKGDVLGTTIKKDGYVVKKSGVYETKLVLSCLLSNNKDTDFKNLLTFRLNGDQQTAHSLEAMEVNIIPPFGEGKNQIHIYTVFIILIIAMITIIYIIVKRTKGKP